MGMIDTALALVFGDGRNVVRDTVEVFRANAEKTAGRDATAREQAMGRNSLCPARDGLTVSWTG